MQDRILRPFSIRPLVSYAQPVLRRLQPALDEIQVRARVRQEAWVRRRQEEVALVLRAVDRLREAAADLIRPEALEVHPVDETGSIERGGSGSEGEMKSTYEVRPNGRGWDVVERRGANRETVRAYSKKQQAMIEGQKLARSRSSELLVYNRKNAVQEHMTFIPTC